MSSLLSFCSLPPDGRLFLITTFVLGTIGDLLSCSSAAHHDEMHSSLHFHNASSLPSLTPWESATSEQRAWFLIHCCFDDKVILPHWSWLELNQNKFVFGEQALFRSGVFNHYDDSKSKLELLSQRVLVKVFMSKADAEFEFSIHMHLYRNKSHGNMLQVYRLSQYGTIFMERNLIAYQEPKGGVSTLQQRIDQKTLNSSSLRLRLALCIAHALCNIKKANVVHGNVVASNILVFNSTTGRGGEVAKLTGFNRWSSHRLIQDPRLYHQQPNPHIAAFQNDLKQFGHLLSSMIYPTPSSSG